jgi:O-antigen/teichoic acid export membrane protein
MPWGAPLHERMDREGTVLQDGARDEVVDPAAKSGTVGDDKARVIDPDRVDPSITSLRKHTARGTLINSAFQIGLYGLGTFTRIAVAAWLTRSDYGMWGVLMAALLALTWIKNWGIADKYIQQSEPDQEAAFQKAFTLELGLSAAFYVLVVIALPIYALAYGRWEMIVPGLVLGLGMPITAFEAPAWIPYRRMQYARQRFLASVNPVITAVCSIGLAAAGMGYWGLIVGGMLGNVSGAIVCTATSPYRLRLRFERGMVREYWSFSWPLVSFSLCAVVILQGSLIAANSVVGLAGIGAIGLATNVAGLSDGVDSIVSQTIYPAVCAVAHRTETLAEVFVKSNRIALMWALPATVGIALFAEDFVRFVLGDRWHSAAGLLAAVAVTCGIGQVGFNWDIFQRAVNDTKPIFRAKLFEVAVFLVISLPAILAFGLTGWAIGFAAITLSQIVARGYYMRKLFGSFSATYQLVRSVIPVIPPVVLILLVRGGVGADRSPARAIAELVLYCAAAILSTVLIERTLVREALGYLKRARKPGRVAQIAPDAGTVAASSGQS